MNSIEHDPPMPSNSLAPSLALDARDYRASYELLAGTVDNLHAELATLKAENAGLRLQLASAINLAMPKPVADSLAAAMALPNARVTFPFDP